jgi:hypothetical protein
LLALNGKLHFDKPPTLPEVLAQLDRSVSPAAVWMAFSNVSENMENSMSEQARRQASDPSGPTGQLATWLANFDLSAVPDTVRERARLLLLDGVGCALVGAQLPWSRTAVESVMALEAEGPCSIIGWGRKATAPVAALLNGTFIQGSNSTTSIRWRRCIASLILPSLLATAERLAASVAIGCWRRRSPASRWVRASAWPCTVAKCCRVDGIPVRCSARMRRLRPWACCYNWTPRASKTPLDWRQRSPPA